MKRNVVTSIILTVCTFGLYGLYWFISITNEVNALSQHRKDTSGGMALFFTIITGGIYGIYWAYILGKKVCEIKRNRDLLATDVSIVYLILQFCGLPIVIFILAQMEINATVDYYEQLRRDTFRNLSSNYYR